MQNLSKKLFYLILIVGALVVSYQTFAYYANGQVKVIGVYNTWAQTKMTLAVLCLGLVALNMVAYKAMFSSSEANHIDTWFLASSIMGLLYFIVSRILLPFVVFA